METITQIDDDGGYVNIKANFIITKDDYYRLAFNVASAFMALLPFLMAGGIGTDVKLSLGFCLCIFTVLSGENHGMNLILI